MSILQGLRVGHGNYGAHFPENEHNDNEKCPGRNKDDEASEYEPVAHTAAYQVTGKSTGRMRSKSKHHSLVNASSKGALENDNRMDEEAVSRSEETWGEGSDTEDESYINGGLSKGHGVDPKSPTHGRATTYFINGAMSDYEELVVEDQALASSEQEKVLNLSPSRMFELTSSPKAFPLHVSAPHAKEPMLSRSAHALNKTRRVSHFDIHESRKPQEKNRELERRRSSSALVSPSSFADPTQSSPMITSPSHLSSSQRSPDSSRGLSMSTLEKNQSSSKVQTKVQSSHSQTRSNKPVPAPLNLEMPQSVQKHQKLEEAVSSPEPSSIPLPPLSLPAFLHLELSSEQRPSPLYIYRSASSDFPYEPSYVKIERLLNFLLLPPLLEQVLWFGALACLDAWLYTFTILPLRFSKAVYLLGQSVGKNIVKESNFILGFVYSGSGRMWRRRGYSRDALLSEASETVVDISRPINNNQTPQKGALAQSTSASENASTIRSHPESSRRRHGNTNLRHRRTKTLASTLMPNDKADILKGLLIILSCWILMYFDASMMYHSIRGQAAIKLYVIYNVLEVCCVFTY